jgi:hypothetical protein
MKNIKTYTCRRSTVRQTTINIHGSVNDSPWLCLYNERMALVKRYTLCDLVIIHSHTCPITACTVFNRFNIYTAVSILLPAQICADVFLYSAIFWRMRTFDRPIPPNNCGPSFQNLFKIGTGPPCQS